MIVFIKLTPPLGTNIGPFMIYSNWDGFTAFYGNNISLNSLLNGITLTVPDGTTQVKIRSNGNCTNSIIVDVGPTVTITSTTTSTSTTSTSTSTTLLPPPPTYPTSTTTSTTLRNTTTTSTTRRVRFSTSTSTSTSTTRRPGDLTTTTTIAIPPTSTSTTLFVPRTSTTTSSTSTTSTTTSTTQAGGGTQCVRLGLSPTNPASTCTSPTSDVYIVHPGGVPCVNGCLMCPGDRIYTDPGHTNLVSGLYHFIALCDQDDVQCARVFYLTNGVVGPSSGFVC